MFASFLKVRFYPRTCNLDNAFAVNVKLPAPAFLVNVFLSDINIEPVQEPPEKAHESGTGIM